MVVWSAIAVFRRRDFGIVFISISGRRLLKLRISFPFVGSTDILLYKSDKMKATNGKKDQDAIRRFISKFLKNLSDNSGGFFKLISELLESDISKTRLINISLEARVGVGDAFVTALLCGVIYTLAGTAFSWVIDRYGGRMERLSVAPVFSRNTFDLRAIGIFETRIIHIIVLLVRYSYKYIMYKIKDRRWFFWHIQSKGS